MDGHHDGRAGNTVHVNEKITTVDGITRGILCPLSGWVLSGEIRSGEFGPGSMDEEGARVRRLGCPPIVIIWNVEGIMCPRQMS